MNQSYYKNSIELYQQRYVHDIEEQYSKLFLELDIANKPNLVIVNIGGGSGSEYSQFIKNKISFDQYHYIEPDAFMADKFQKLFNINKSNSNVFIHNKPFDQVSDQISSVPNKIILMNSCFHHFIWVKEFLDLIKSSMHPGDYFVVCHEPNNSYANSLLMYINYFARFIFTDFLLRRLGLRTSKKLSMIKSVGKILTMTW